MPSASHGVVTLPIWSEPTATGYHALNKHNNGKFLTVIAYPRHTTGDVPNPKDSSDKGHQKIPRSLDEAEVEDQQDDQEEYEETPTTPIIPEQHASEEDQSEPGIYKVENQVQSKVRFWSENASASIAKAGPMPTTSSKPGPVAKSVKSDWNPGKGSIAAIVIMCVLTCGCIAYLIYWYTARECKARRRRRLRTNENAFDQSSLTLGDDTSKTLDEFLMKDVEPERTSIMFSRSRSPSISYVVNEAPADGRNSKTSRNSYEASLNSLLKLDPLARTSTDDTTQPSFVIDLTDSSKSTSTQPSSATPHLSPQYTSPRASTGSSIVPSTTRSSQLWETTTAATTERNSLLSKPQKSPRSSLAASSLDGSMLPAPASSMLPSRSQHGSNASKSSSRYSGQSPIHSYMRSLPRNINDSGFSQQSHRRSYSGQSRSMTISPIAESTDPSTYSQQQSRPVSPASLFRYSDAT